MCQSAHYALQAAKLLGVKSLDDVIASEAQNEDKEEFRPPLLGLGADPKKHGKVHVPCAAMKVPDLMLTIAVHCSESTPSCTRAGPICSDEGREKACATHHRKKERREAQHILKAQAAR